MIQLGHWCIGRAIAGINYTREMQDRAEADPAWARGGWVTDYPWETAQAETVNDGLADHRLSKHDRAGAWKYGYAQLTFDHFPFLLGDQLKVKWSCTKGVGESKQLHIALQCIETRATDTPSEAARTTLRRIYLHETTIDNPRAIEPGGSLAIRIDLPADAQPTQLSKHPVRYWELLVHIVPYKGKAYRRWFLVPIYAPPA